MPRFSDLVGQNRAISFLRRAVGSGRLAHAYIFSGPEGVGKFAAAHAFASFLLCTERGDDACGRCPGCRQVAAGNHPDFQVIKRVPDKKDLAIALVRDMGKRLALRAALGGYKVAIIRDAEEMNRSGQTCLLKTLEEPGSDTVMILVVASRGSLAKTVVSRCQGISFFPLGRNQVSEVLVNRHGWDPVEARTVAAFSDGSPGRALSLDKEFLVNRRLALIRQLRQLPEEGFGAVESLAREIVSADKRGAPEADQLRPSHGYLLVMMSWYRDAVRQGLLGANAELQNEDLAREVGMVDWRQALSCLQAVYHAVKALKASANRTLTMDVLLLDLSLGNESC